MSRQRKLPPGMSKRGRVYYANLRKDGQRIRRRLSSDFEAAKEMLNDLRARADFGLLDNNCPLSAIKRDYLRDVEQRLRPATVMSYKHGLEMILADIPVEKVNQLTIDRVTTYRQDRLASKVNSGDAEHPIPGASQRTVNMEVGALSTMLAWAVKHGYIGNNPLAKVKPLPTDEKRKQRRALSAEEMMSILEVSPEHLKPVWRMFATTGVRLAELVGMRFDDVDFDHAEVTVSAVTNKSHKERTIPLDDEMLATIKTLRDKAKDRQPVPGRDVKQSEQQAAAFSKEHVFVTAANTPWRNNLLTRFYTVCKKAGIEDAKKHGAVDIHSLRVTFTTLALEGGASPKAVQAILGHSTLAMTMGGYAKATDKAKRSAVAALPFAKISQPEHLLPFEVQGGHKMAPSRSDSPKRENGDGHKSLSANAV